MIWLQYTQRILGLYLGAGVTCEHQATLKGRPLPGSSPPAFPTSLLPLLLTFPTQLCQQLGLLLPLGLVCPSCGGGKKYKRERVINPSVYETFCEVKSCFVPATEALGGAPVLR